MKVLVTGAAGFIGFHLAESLVNAGYKVDGLDNVNNYYDVNLKFARFPSTWADTTELQELGYNSSIGIKEDLSIFIEWFKNYHIFILKRFSIIFRATFYFKCNHQNP
ncbi:hypothetical protein LCGC14_0119060 [marine sediment metagenome]|uniref:NAD-dependent epimerase/dehydratase domain-containing protein n=1 Tax=marine sediment metagenome TaxID=412755 RepID=A0A0F9VN66_9ZZZZ|nr:NAD-dependent epimerase/dehydratase family protein [Maribacter sp.]